LIKDFDKMSPYKLFIPYIIYRHEWEFVALITGKEREDGGQNHCTPTIGFAFRKGKITLLFACSLSQRVNSDRSFAFLNDESLSMIIFLACDHVIMSDWYSLGALWSYWIHQIPPSASYSKWLILYKSCILLVKIILMI
jgi:hypothetical protein